MKNLNAFLKRLSLFLSMILCAGFNGSYAQVGGKLRTDPAAHCGCPVINYVAQQAHYYQPLSATIPYSTFKKFNQWKLPDGIKSFNSLFTIDEWSSGSGDDFYKELNIVSPRGPIKIVHPEGTFTINLSPCANRYHSYDFSISVACKPSIASQIGNFDYAKFENTTLGYVHLYFQLTGKRPDQMIRIAFKLWAQTYNLDGVNQAIAKINEAYHTGIPLATEKNYRDSLMISGILDSLVSKKLRQEQVFNTGFILSEPGIHPPTYDEQYHMEILFQAYCSIRAFELFNTRKFLPDFVVNLKIRQAVVEISSKILSPIINNTKRTPPYTEVRAEICGATFNNESMISIPCNLDICLPPAVVAGTSLAIDFDRGNLYTTQLQTKPGFDCTPYPQFARDTNAHKAHPPQKWALYDTLFTHFTGFVIPVARFKLPYGKTGLLFKGQDVIINNRVIAGCLAIDLDPQNNSQAILIQADGINTTCAVTKLLAILNQAGLKGVLTKKTQQQLYVYFKKTAR